MVLPLAPQDRSRQASEPHLEVRRCENRLKNGDTVWGVNAVIERHLGWEKSIAYYIPIEKGIGIDLM